MILKTIDTKLATWQVAYTNINVREDDNPETQRRKKKIVSAACRYIRSERRRVEALILDNFDRDSWWCTFTFRDSKLPPTRALVSRRFTYFAAQLRAAGYPNLRYLKVSEHRHGVGRWHLHCIMDGVPKAAIKDTWIRIYGSQEDKPRVKPLDPTKVVPHEGKAGLAAYLTKEVPDGLGRHSYTVSRGANRLTRPRITRDIVPDDYPLTVPTGCRVIERETLAENPYGITRSISWLKPEAFEKGDKGGLVRKSRRKLDKKG